MKKHEEVEALAILIHDLRKFKSLTLGELAVRQPWRGVPERPFRAVPLRHPDGKTHPCALGLQLNSFTSQGLRR